MSPTYSITKAPITPQCPQILDNEISIRDIAIGTILVDGPILEPISFLDIQTGIEYFLPGQDLDSNLYLGGIVSPNKNMHVSITGRQNESGAITNRIIWIVNSQGELLNKNPAPLTSVGGMRWLDDEHLVFYSENTIRDGSVIVMNPFTNEQLSVSNKLPDFYADASLRMDWQVEYSPDLSWVVYFGNHEETGLGPIVFDVNKEEVIWRPKFSGNNYLKPLWSKTRNEVAIVAEGNLYIIGRDGQEKAILDEDRNRQIKWPSWSPDGRFIAFWSNYILMVYDFENQTLLNYCINDNYPDIAIWSPDSDQFVIGAALDQGGKLVDIQKKNYI